MTRFCRRCNRYFRSVTAINRHFRDSSKHWQCGQSSDCEFDGHNWDDLLDHFRESKCARVCEGCNDGGGSWWAWDDDCYQDHVEDENVCTICDRHFQTPNNLYQHRLSHRKPGYECYCCDRNFKTYGGMIIHLERGTCSDTSEISLNALAAECHKCDYFIDIDYRDDMLDMEDLQYLNPYHDVKPYICPTCGTHVSKLSSLFQHVESNSCRQTINDSVIGQLRNYLKSRL